MSNYPDGVYDSDFDNTGYGVPDDEDYTRDGDVNRESGDTDYDREYDYER